MSRIMKVAAVWTVLLIVVALTLLPVMAHNVQCVNSVEKIDEYLLRVYGEKMVEQLPPDEKKTFREGRLYLDDKDGSWTFVVVLNNGNACAFVTNGGRKEKQT